jgi:hypothetical protein
LYSLCFSPLYCRRTPPPAAPVICIAIASPLSEKRNMYPCPRKPSFLDRGYRRLQFYAPLSCIRLRPLRFSMVQLLASRSLAAQSLASKPWLPGPCFAGVRRGRVDGIVKQLEVSKKQKNRKRNKYDRISGVPKLRGTIFISRSCGCKFGCTGWCGEWLWGWWGLLWLTCWLELGGWVACWWVCAYVWLGARCVDGCVG